ncbi:MAG: TonB-dependent receptor [Novosphingobium sp.]|nr:TonB-dependent receptor [Novosphingobium sp.]MCP5403603.1 TonB-dependent receptor [Novosphingobium sp.]
MNRVEIPDFVSLRAALCGGVAALGLAMPSFAGAQEAEQAPPAAESTYDDYASGNEIVVTATKREQTLQDVPVAVSVTSAEALERAQVRDLFDLQTLVPSLRVRQNQSSANTNFFIRGFGNGANNAGIEPSVGVFIDNVYRSRAAAQIADLPDVERIEVLRGPQSTLFGKNASAGVISIVTKKPRFEFGGNVEASYGNFDAVVLKGVVTGPVTQDIAVSLAGSYNTREGFTKNLITGNGVDERDRWFVRGQLLFEPDSDISVRIIGDYGKIDEHCCEVLSVKASSATAALLALGGQVNPADDPFGNITYYNFDPVNEIENYGISGQVDYQLGDFTLTSITSWRKNNSFNNYDADFTSAELVAQSSYDIGIKTFTQELRLSGNLLDRLSMLLGAYYFNEKINQTGAQIVWGAQARPYFNLAIAGATGGALSVPMLEATFGALEGDPTKYTGSFFAAGQGLDERYRMKNDAVSIFGQLDFEIADRLTLTGGANYTYDKKRFVLDVGTSDVFAGLDFNNPAYAPFRYQLLLGGALQSGLPLAQAQAFAAANQNNPAANPLNALRGLQIAPPFLNVPNAVEPGKTSDDNVSWTARLAYELNNRVSVYAGISKGFKASSINLSSGSRPAPGDAAAIGASGIGVVNQTYGSRFAGPEKSTVYEAGIKADWGVAGANFAIFEQSIRGFQSNIFTGTGFLLANAGKESVFGLEFEGFAKPVEPLTLGLSVTYLDPVYDEFTNSAFGDVTGIMPADIPPLSASFSIDYDLELANADRLILHADYLYESETQNIEGLPGFIVRDPVSGQIIDFQPGLDAAREFTRQVDELSASLTYAMRNGFELTVWGRNLLDDRYIAQIFDAPAQTGAVSGYANSRRTYGVGARFRW